jgi:hypothetical protein
MFDGDRGHRCGGRKIAALDLMQRENDKCERRFRLDRRLARAERKGELVISHAPSGWTTEDVARNYLTWLREFMGPGPIALVWDVFAAHRCEAARAQAQSMGILLEFIPAGTTGERQPLNRRIFGNLKGRANARFDRLWSMNATPIIQDSIDVLLSVWKLIQQDEITDAWEPILRLRSNQTRFHLILKSFVCPARVLDALFGIISVTMVPLFERTGNQNRITSSSLVPPLIS